MQPIRRLLHVTIALWRWPHYGLCLALAAVTALYAPTLGQSFHGDDFVAFTEFRSRSFFAYAREVFLFQDANFYWRPIGKITDYVLYHTAGLDPFAYRGVSLLLFLATLVLLYAFCLREGLGRGVALGAVLAFGLLPNHVVSVTWVTNASRLMAVMFCLAGIVCLQAPPHKRSWRNEAACWLLFILAAMSDETSLALAPLPFLYLTFMRDEPVHWPSVIVRGALFGGLIAILLPLQFHNTLNDEPRLWTYGIGPHVITQTWALASQLVLPLTKADPIDILLRDVPALQWAAGLVAIAGGVLALAVGSRWLRFLVLWCGLALAPFTLWDTNYTSPRYVYMAAVPFAVILAWGIANLLPLLARLRLAAWPARAALGVSLLVVLAIGARASSRRDAAWGRQTELYRPLANSLTTTLPRVPRGSRLIIYYGTWPDFWASAVAQTVYGDRSLRVIDVPPERIDSNWPRLRNNDIILYYLGDRFVQTGLATTSVGQTTSIGQTAR